VWFFAFGGWFAVENHTKRVMFAFDDLGVKGFSACFAVLELNSFKLFLAAAAFERFLTLALGTMISSGVCRLVAVLPKQVEVAVWGVWLEWMLAFR
jgi:hypothetical protein